MLKPKLISRIKATRCQHGVTLIELMVAMAVSSVIMLGISNIYLSTKKSYTIHDEFSRIQENGRYSLETLSTNIRNAGFFGCASGQGVGKITNGLNQSNTVTWNFETGVMGFEAVGTDIGNTKVVDPDTAGGAASDWTTAAGMTSKGVPIVATVDPNILPLAVKGSDILILRTTDGLGVRIAQNNSGAQVFVDDTTGGFVANACPQNASSSYNINGISGICEGDILLVSDCSKSRIFQAANIQTVGGGPGACGKAGKACFNLTHPAAGNPGNADVTWKAEDTFGPDSEIMKVVTKTYFVGIPAGGGQPSLYVQENGSATPDQLVEGIENMQILYGVDSNNDGAPDRYYSADDVPDVDGDSDSVFDGVVSVKMSLLARTPENMPGINRTVADYAKLTYNMVSPAAPIVIDPIPVDATSTDRRMRKVYDMTIKIRNKSFNIAN